MKKTEKIAQLNDHLRMTFASGRVMLSASVSALPPEEKGAVLAKVRDFSAFTPDNDPHKERDFGAFDHRGTRYFWKIDYYDRALKWGSEDPSDPEQTTRVLTIMEASEY